MSDSRDEPTGRFPAIDRRDSPGRPAPRVDATRLWAGGGLAAVVAALVAVVCLLVARGIFDVTIFLQGDAALVEATMGTFAVVAALAALLATALMHGLLVAAPEPFRFFTWITGLLVLVAVLTPFATTLSVAEQVASALSNLAIGMAVVTLVRSVGESAVEPSTG